MFSKKTPVYLKIRHHVMGEVKKSKGNMTKISSVRKLSQEFQANPLTVRKALKLLIDEGALIPHKGKGTFVNPEWSGIPKKEATSYRNIGVIESAGLLIHHHWVEWELLSVVGKSITRRNDALEILKTDQVGEYAADQILQGDIDGLIWISPSPKHFDTLKALEARGLPVSVANTNYYDQGFIGASVDYFRLGAMAAEMLLGDGSDNRIGFIAQTHPDADSLILNGFTSVFDQRGLAWDKSMIINDNSLLKNNIHKLFTEKECRKVFLMSRYLLDVNAVVSALPEALQQQIDIVSEYLEPAQDRVSIPNINYINRPFATTAERAVEKLYEQFEGKSVARDIELFAPTYK